MCMCISGILGDKEMLFKLYTSVRQKDLNAISMFLPDPEMKDNFGRTMWHCAMKPGSLEAEELIDPENEMLVASIPSQDQQHQWAI